MSSPRSRRHHTVPRFYLSRFAASERLWAFDLSKGRDFESSVGNVTIERDFHTYDFNDTGPDDEFEHLVAMFENLHAEGLAQLGTRWPPSVDTRARLAHFVAFQFVRSARWRDLSLAMQQEEMKQFARDAAESALSDGAGREWYRNLIGGVADDELDAHLEFAVGGEYEVRIAPQEHIREMLAVLGEPDVAATLMSASWELVHAPDGEQFLISDHPVALWSPEALPLAIAGAEQVRIPVDRSRLLVIRSDGRREGKRRVAGREEVRRINWVTGLQARRYLLGHPTWREQGPSLGHQLAEARSRMKTHGD